MNDFYNNKHLWTKKLKFIKVRVASVYTNKYTTHSLLSTENMCVHIL